ncbi:hypothetical protein LSH36_74g01017 [Paralvinella palmiformis]|uniref:Small ribosomal subunit protein mS26 n=1 Tax=Paralvinella palmiformis TaxID=53620 RepID=A0AAD9K2L2_9ANNE|nr:hypothetical protein LSH36_74g01017 [Paralvinella palmiformis]
MSLIIKSSLLSRVPLVGTYCIHGEDHLVLTQMARWRKRRWATPSYRQRAYVRKPTLTDPEELNEIRLRYNRYRTMMKSVRRFIVEKRAAKEKEIHSAARMKQEHDAIEHLLAENDKWNEETAKLRLVRMEAEEREVIKDQQKKLMEFELMEAERLKKANRYIMEQQSLLKTFINAENLEAEIERALNSKKSFNFVIDKDGLIHKEQSDGKLAEETLEQQIKKLSMKEKAKDEEQSTTP